MSTDATIASSQETRDIRVHSVTQRGDPDRVRAGNAPRGTGRSFRSTVGARRRKPPGSRYAVRPAGARMFNP